MKEYCTGRILFSTLALGTGLLLADSAVADKGGNGQSAASIKRAGRQVKSVFSNKSDAARKPKVAPRGGVAGAPCPNPDHDCLTTGTPGCSDEVCCDTVCAVDSFCCTTAWDGICVSEALQLCGGGGGDVCPNPDHDCGTTGTPGCSDEVCCDTVCAVDSFCCQVAWDGICVSEAFALCGLELPCPNPDHDCFTTGTPGCSDEECCNSVCAADPFCCQAAWDGICVSEADLFCGEPCTQDCPAGAVIEAEPCGGDTNGGCNAPPTGASGNCCFAHDGVGCEDPACEAAVCAIDSFCCATAWDGICAGEAAVTPPCDCQAGAAAFEPIACGDTVCGTQFSSTTLRDTDWYSFTLAADAIVTWTVYSEMPAVTFIIDISGGCPVTNADIVAQSTAGQCPQIACAALPAGDYVAFVAPGVFADFPCGGTNNDYVGKLACSGCDGDVVAPTGVVDIDDLLFIITHWGPCP